jgi:hypothetical protein
MFVFPMRIAPASRRRVTAGASTLGVSTARRSDASHPGSPAVAIASFTVNGKPWSGPGFASAAAARARSRSSVTIAFSSALRASIRSTWASSTSSGLASPRATAATISVTCT